MDGETYNLIKQRERKVIIFQIKIDTRLSPTDYDFVNRSTQMYYCQTVQTVFGKSLVTSGCIK